MTSARGKLERAFWQFHTDNPRVYMLLARYAYEWKRNHSHCGINALVERVRWQIGIDTKSSDGLKINNNHAPFYARLLEQKEPNMVGFFRMRQQKVQCSFGPRNENLPPGAHIA